MTGQELIDWIKEHNAEDKELLVYYDGYTGDVGSPNPNVHEWEPYKGKIFLN